MYISATLCKLDLKIVEEVLSYTKCKNKYFGYKQTSFFFMII